MYCKRKQKCGLYAFLILQRSELVFPRYWLCNIKVKRTQVFKKNHISEQNKLDYFKTRQSEAKWFYFKNLQEAKRFDNDFVFLKGKKELTFFSKPPVSPVATIVNDTGDKFAAGINDTGGNLPPVSTTPAANLQTVSLEQYQAAETLKRQKCFYRLTILPQRCPN